VLSVLQQMRNGSAVAVNLVGSDGMVGLGVYLGALTYPMEAICQAPGTFLRMGAAAFQAEVTRNGPLLTVLHGYTQAVLEIRGQIIGCERFHAVEARAARWMLEMDDRVAQDEFTMTHEFLALMLGVRRQTVSAVASDLSRQGLIANRRGFIEIGDRAGLEAATCECLRVHSRRVRSPRRATLPTGTQGSTSLGRALDVDTGLPDRRGCSPQRPVDRLVTTPQTVQSWIRREQAIWRRVRRW
jgi:CRP-like cAMP-binding protein